MTTVKVSAKGWVVIPQALRDKYGLKKGIRIQVVDYGGVLGLVPLPDDPVEALHGMLAEGPSLTEELLAEHDHERGREEDHRG
jgi:AbrB family looped-hinge helix DNA binding protein